MTFFVPPFFEKERGYPHREQSPEIFEQREIHLLSSVIMFPQTPHRGCRTETMLFPYLHVQVHTFAEVISVPPGDIRRRVPRSALPPLR